MRCFLFILMVLTFNNLFSQGITVDDTSNTPEELASYLLNGSCSEIYNVAISSNRAVARFEKGDSNFPIESGIIIRSGIAKYSEGQFRDENLDSQLSDEGDAQLQEISNSYGDVSRITDVAFFEFEFTTLSEYISFDFLFASNEYGQWQCSFNDIIAFMLTEIETGEARNLAVVPGTENPVSITNIRDQEINPACLSVNPQLFGAYNVNNPLNSAINMRGQTVLLSAAAVVKKNTRYKIRFAVGDTYDGSNDSAIFLAAGSFVQEINLGDPRAICSDGTLLLDTHIDSDIYEHVWRKNGIIIPNETNSTIQIYGPGTYSVSLSDSAKTCEITGEIEIVEPSVSPPIDLESCEFDGNTYVFDLNTNSYDQLNVDRDIYLIKYYDSLDTDPEGAEIEESELTNYKTAISKQIGIKVFDKSTGSSCGAFQTFELRVVALQSLPDPDPIVLCDGVTVDLTQNIGPLFNQYQFDMGNYMTSFYFNEADALLEENVIINPLQYGVQADLDITFWVRVDTNEKNCVTILQQVLEVDFLPSVDQIIDLYGCSAVTLPVLNIGSYYSALNGMGTMFKAGDIITASGVYYIYEDEDGLCRNQSQFAVFLLSDYSISSLHCGSYRVPSILQGSFYTASAGPNGDGELLRAGTVITKDQTIYLYAEIDGDVCEYSYELKIAPIPEVDGLNDVFRCVDDEVYLLPAIQNGQYFTKANRQGVELNEGDAVAQTQRIYINAIANSCTAESFFNVNVLPIPQVDIFPDIYNCAPFELPVLAYGAKYYTGSNKTGISLSAGDLIYENQKIYIFNEYEEVADSCTNESFFNIAILGVQVDELPNVAACDSYILPVLNVGDYYTGSKATGESLFAGQLLEESQNIYIYAINEDRFFCDDETVFRVTITETPVLPILAENNEGCGSFSLVDYQLDNSVVEYFRAPEAKNKIMPSEYTLTQAGTYEIYVRATASENSNCFDEKIIHITVLPLAEMEIIYDVICVDVETEEVIKPAYLSVLLNDQDFEVLWYMAGEKIGEGLDFITEQYGEYTAVAVPKRDGVQPCGYKPAVFRVDRSSMAIVDVDIGRFFHKYTDVQIALQKGYGTYVFQLDQGLFQESTTFNKVSTGLHQIKVKDTYGNCGITVVEFLVLDYPKYFTPNGDGVNDVWNVWDLGNQKVQLQIYDRFGRQVGAVISNALGWDGTYNGYSLPPADYWFSLKYPYEDRKIPFSSHFSLKR